jgi:hypothetical protein
MDVDARAEDAALGAKNERAASVFADSPGYVVQGSLDLVDPWRDPPGSAAGCVGRAPRRSW